MHPIVSSDSNIDSLLLDFCQSADIPVSMRHLEKPVELVRITTETGRTITLTPESVFGLKKKDGKSVLDLSGGEDPIPSNLRNFTPLPDEGIVFLGKGDYRLWYIAGLVLSCGSFTGSESRPATIRLPVARRHELEWLEDFIHSYSYRRGWRSAANSSWSSLIKNTGPYAQLSSRILDIIINDECHGVVLNGCNAINVTAFHATEEGWEGFQNADHAKWQGFFAGILAGSHETPEGRVFVSRNALVARWVHHELFFRFGIPAKLSVNPFEPVERMHARRVQNPHSVFIDRKFYQNVQAAGLSQWDEDLLTNASGPYLSSISDEIIKVEPVGAGRGVEFSGKGVGTINGFLFDLSFDVEPLAVEIASMDELFVDVADPETVIANAPVHTTHLHGVI